MRLRRPKLSRRLFTALVVGGAFGYLVSLVVPWPWAWLVSLGGGFVLGVLMGRFRRRHRHSWQLAERWTYTSMWECETCPMTEWRTP